jgi:hypothetical protein
VDWVIRGTWTLTPRPTAPTAGHPSPNAQVSAGAACTDAVGIELNRSHASTMESLQLQNTANSPLPEPTCPWSPTFVMHLPDRPSSLGGTPTPKVPASR